MADEEIEQLEAALLKMFQPKQVGHLLKLTRYYKKNSFELFQLMQRRVTFDVGTANDGQVHYEIESSANNSQTDKLIHLQEKWHDMVQGSREAEMIHFGAKAPSSSYQSVFSQSTQKKDDSHLSYNTLTVETQPKFHSEMDTSFQDISESYFMDEKALIRMRKQSELSEYHSPHPTALTNLVAQNKSNDSSPQTGLTGSTQQTETKNPSYDKQYLGNMYIGNSHDNYDLRVTLRQQNNNSSQLMTYEQAMSMNEGGGCCFGFCASKNKNKLSQYSKSDQEDHSAFKHSSINIDQIIEYSEQLSNGSFNKQKQQRCSIF